MLKQSFFGFCLLMLCSLAWSAGDPVAGKKKSQVCVACHGAQGNSVVGTWPKIAGQNALYSYRQLVLFKKGQEEGRWNPSMYPIAKNLSDEDMQDLAAYFAEQQVTLGEVAKPYLALGEKIYRGGNLRTHVSACSACHGPRGLGNRQAGFPALSGQHAAYVKKALYDYQKGVRNVGYAAVMVAIAGRMTDAEIEAVAHYVEGLH